MTAQTRRIGAWLTSGAILLLFPTDAFAHAPIPGVGSFWNGVLHPVIVPLHLLVLLGVGLLLGQNVPRASRVGLAAFVAAFLVGVAMAGPLAPPLVAVVTASATAGLLVAFGRSATGPLIVVALAGAVLVALDSAPDTVTSHNEWLTRAGTLCGASLVVTLAGGLATAFVRPWQRTAVRVAGSWIAAASTLVLAFAVTGRGS